MFGLNIPREELALLAVGAYFLVRVAFLVGQLVSRWLTDGPLPKSASVTFLLLSGVGASAGLCAAVSLLLAGKPMFLRYTLYAAAVLFGGMFGMALELKLGGWASRLSVWLASFRLQSYRDRLASLIPAERLTAAKRLFELGSYARPAAPELVTATTDELPDVRAYSFLALLFDVHDKSSDVVAAARVGLRDPEPLVRTSAAMVLVKSEAAPPEDVLPALGEGMMLPDEPFAGLAAGAIGEMGEAAAAAAPLLRTAIFERDPPNDAAMYTLQHIGEAGVPVLVELLHRGSEMNRQAAAYILGEMGEKAAAAVPALREASTSKDAVLSAAASAALSKLGANKG
jgi:HEAT repeat protein